MGPMSFRRYCTIQLRIAGNFQEKAKQQLNVYCQQMRVQTDACSVALWPKMNGTMQDMPDNMLNITGNRMLLQASVAIIAAVNISHINPINPN